jgi:hypothetical protein
MMPIPKQKKGSKSSRLHLHCEASGFLGEVQNPSGMELRSESIVRGIRSAGKISKIWILGTLKSYVKLLEKSSSLGFLIDCVLRIAKSDDLRNKIMAQRG